MGNISNFHQFINKVNLTAVVFILCCRVGVDVGLGTLYCIWIWSEVLFGPIYADGMEWKWTNVLIVIELNCELCVKLNWKLILYFLWTSA